MQDLTGSGYARPIRRQRVLVETCSASAAAYGKDDIREKAELKWKQYDFDGGAITLVAEKMIGDFERNAIHRAGSTDPEIEKSGAAKVLDGIRDAGRQDLDQDAISAMRNRIRSPG
jgi:hypothetical protein